MDTVVYLIRHSDVTPKGNIKWINSDDSEQLINEKSFLSVSGEKRAEKISKHKELQNIDAVYSSDYVSTLETAKYIALENNTIINIDDRFNERKIGQLSNMKIREFERLQKRDFDFKLSGGESLNQTKKRIIEATKNVLMFETGNRIAIISHPIALTCLLSSWCELGYNYDDDIILSYGEETIIDGRYSPEMIFKVTFDGMIVKNIEVIEVPNI